MYDSIVIGFDGSPYSLAALRESAGWIKRHGGHAVLVHGVFFDEEEFGIAPVQHEKRIENGNRLCELAKSDAAAEFGVDAEMVVCEGEPPQVLIDVAKGRAANLIALGTHGRRGLKRMILGSVTSSVATDAPCDVLAVKRPCGDCPDGYKKILVPFDGSEQSKKALARACEVAKLEDGKVTVLYSIPRYEEMVEFYKTQSVRDALVGEAAKIVDSARQYAADLGTEVMTAIKEGSASDNIVSTAETVGTDLIVMGSHGRRGINKAIIGSTTERVTMLATCPVLIVR